MGWIIVNRDKCAGAAINFASQQAQPMSLFIMNEYASSSQGIFMSRSEWSTRWERWVESDAPLAPLPRSYGWGAHAAGVFTVYGAMYSSDSFEDFCDFKVFCWYTSSAQQALYRHGPSDPAHILPWFIPVQQMPESIAVDNRIMNPKDICDQLISGLVLPDTLQWLWDVVWLEAEASSYGDEILIIAQTQKGYVTVFTVDDG
ncbi:MAG: hypothetical protein AAFV53_03405 [Myxococcota bacterium]